MSANHQQHLEEATEQQSQGQQSSGVVPYHLVPRREGYRPAAVRESRMKERYTKPVANDRLSIKIELDLEVEICVLRKVVTYRWYSDFSFGGSIYRVK
jgi:hypothetical protein